MVNLVAYVGFVALAVFVAWVLWGVLVLCIILPWGARVAAKSGRPYTGEWRSTHMRDYYNELYLTHRSRYLASKIVDTYKEWETSK